ncbi:MAG: prolyl-tRNA synthetase, partial [Candidatus Moranbacteria bacterium]|nr:prolyl-tRNA synthetase [Candidatus Moranbacteria bacterium]
IFSFGGTKSEQLGLYFKDDDGSQKPVILGSYGIGITRLMGIVVEKFADEKGLVWPESVAPFKAHLISLGADERAEEVYKTLTEAGIEVLYDDRDARAGEKFADSDLLGIPYRVVIGKRSAESGEAEVKSRTGEETEIVGISGLVKYFNK